MRNKIVVKNKNIEANMIGLLGTQTERLSYPHVEHKPFFQLHGSIEYCFLCPQIMLKFSRNSLKAGTFDFFELLSNMYFGIKILY